jgi:hypothetical protein
VRYGVRDAAERFHLLPFESRRAARDIGLELDAFVGHGAPCM